MNFDMRKWLYPVLASMMTLGTLTLSACNTIEGAGQDIEEAGEEIEDTAEDAS